MLKAKAFAKINLILKILSKRPDGFHDIDTIMQNISLYDDILIEDFSGGIVVDCDDKAVPSGKANICYKAAELMMNISEKKGVKIGIRKQIPSGAGLGGGSSDAAAVLTALNRLWSMGLSSSKLSGIAAELGSDVPFFLVGGRALCSGRGEIVKKLPDLKESFFVLIKPAVSIPTKWAYEEFDRQALSGDAVSGYKCYGSKTGGIVCSEEAGAEYENDFEKVVLSEFPDIKKAKNALLAAGAGPALMTGSGSAVFGAAGSRSDADMILSKIRPKYRDSFVVHTVNYPIELI